MAATNMTPNLRDLTYEERLSKLKLPTIERRERGDLIAVYRASEDLEKIENEDLYAWDLRNTRGYGKKMKKTTCRKDIRKYSFCIDALKPGIAWICKWYMQEILINSRPS